MPKQLYEEAIADVKRVKQVAEDNAKRTLLDMVTPRIRDFIDRALLNEQVIDDGMDDGMDPIAPGPPPLGNEDELMSDIAVVDPRVTVPVSTAGAAAAITPPDAEGKVTLDIDALCSSEPGVPVAPPLFGAPEEIEGEYEISLESIDALKPIAVKLGVKGDTTTRLHRGIRKLVEQIAIAKTTNRKVQATQAFHEQITRMISHVENMYGYVQEQVKNPARKSSYETMLEASFNDLTKLQESIKMSQKTKKGRINEEDVTLKLTGLPDDIDLDTVGVDLITGDEEGADGDVEADDDVEGTEGGDDAGLDDFDFGGDQGGGDQGQEDEEDQMESRRLSDDTIVEIDEKMLAREVARMRRLREEKTGPETKAQSWGNGPDNLGDFGGGADEGEPLDAEIVDKSTSPGALPLGEADEDLDEVQDQMDEQDQDLDEADDDDLEQYGAGMDELEEIGDQRTRDQLGGSQTSVLSKDKSNPADRQHEGLRRLAFEKRLQERSRERAGALKRAAASARSNGNGRRLSEVKKEYAIVVRRFNESVARSKKISQLVAESTRKLQAARLNSAAARPAENTAVQSLRKELAETNLFNAKLTYANKVLQSEQLNPRQKSQVIRQLDSAKTIREAKLVYESLSSTLAGMSKPVTEARTRTVLGSGSRTTRPAATTLTEGHEAERWAQLAGITKR